MEAAWPDQTEKFRTCLIIRVSFAGAMDASALTFAWYKI